MADSKLQTSEEDINRIRILNVCFRQFREIMVILLEKDIKPGDIQKYWIFYITKLNDDQKSIIQKSSSYDAYDFSLLYILIRNISSANPKALKVSPPTKTWGFDNSSLITIGDAIEKMRKFRNKYTHVTSSVSNGTFKSEWGEFDVICTFLDNKCGGNFKKSLAKEKNLRILDERTKEELKRAKEEIEEKNKQNKTLRRRLTFTGSFAVFGSPFTAYGVYTFFKKENDSRPKFTSCPAEETEYITERGKQTKVEWSDIEALDKEDARLTPVLIEGKPPGSMLGKGTHTSIYVVTDSNDQSSVCRIRYTVRESNVRCEEAQPSDIYPEDGYEQKIVSWNVSSIYTTTDYATPKVEQVSGPPSGSFFGAGSHTVVYKITDSNGLSVNCNLTFNVFDHGNVDQKLRPELNKFMKGGTIIKQGVVMQKLNKEEMTENAESIKNVLPESFTECHKWITENLNGTTVVSDAKRNSDGRQEHNDDIAQTSKSDEEASVKEGDSDYIAHKQEREGVVMPKRNEEEMADNSENMKYVLPELFTKFQKWIKEKLYGTPVISDTKHDPDKKQENKEDTVQTSKSDEDESVKNGDSDNIAPEQKMQESLYNGTQFQRVCPENRGWNEAPVPRNITQHRPKGTNHTRSDDCHQITFPKYLTKTTAKDGHPCNICYAPVGEAYLYKAPTRDFIFHGKCLARFLGG